ncbi:12247_t:CDS:2, partial [Gigaspora rosea]
ENNNYDLSKKTERQPKNVSSRSKKIVNNEILVESNQETLLYTNEQKDVVEELTSMELAKAENTPKVEWSFKYAKDNNSKGQYKSSEVRGDKETSTLSSCRRKEIGIKENKKRFQLVQLQIGLQ